MQQIENYAILPVGRAKDISGQQFGDFIVLYRTNGESSSKKTYWLCQCIKCKQYFIKNAQTLLKGTNECECNNDLTGKIFGRWTVQYLCNYRTKNRGKIYHCKCECGNEKDVPAETLKRGESQSCGCYRIEQYRKFAEEHNRIDLTGQRFGKLVALSPIYRENKHTLWHCKCDCGNECDIDMGNLRSGKSQSCGCTHSKNEEKIIKLLTENNIDFVYQKRFEDFKTKEFDFYVNNQYIIEFDGQQHFFFSGSGWDTQEHFDRIRQNDLLKNKYCFDHNIPLIRIPYYADYTFNDLKIDTTQFLLTPEKENNYYQSWRVK